jgi:hypothetical protein
MGHRYQAVSAGTAVVWVLDPLLLGEEVGELFKAARKSHAGIAYSEPHDADAAGELADVLIVMCAVANRLVSTSRTPSGPRRPSTPRGAGTSLTRSPRMRAEVVVELRSPDDETYAKLDWYARLGVGQVLVVDVATRRAEHPQPPHCHRRMGPAQSVPRPGTTRGMRPEPHPSAVRE